MSKKKKSRSLFSMFTSTSEDDDQDFEFEGKRVGKWDLMDCLDFCHALDFSQNQKEYVTEVFRKNKIDGKQLLKIRMRPLNKLFSTVDGKLSSPEAFHARQKLLQGCKFLQKNNGKYDKSWFTVFIKICKSTDPRNPSTQIFDKVVNFTNLLSSKKRYYEFYFEPFVRVIQINESREQVRNRYGKEHQRKKPKGDDLELHFQKCMKKEIQALRKEVTALLVNYKKKFSTPLDTTYLKLLPPELRPKTVTDAQSPSKKYRKSKRVEEEEKKKEQENEGEGGGGNKEEDGEEEEGEGEDDQKTTLVPQNDLRRDIVKVKLVITEIYGKDDKSKKKVRQFLSPIFSRIPKYRQQFGIFHTALIVGPWYLDWNDREVVIPKSFASTKALFAVDVGAQHLTQQNEDIDIVAKKVCDVVHKWNTRIRYNTQKTKKSGNCQHFVDEIFDTLNVSFQEAGPLKIFFSQLREKGVAEPKYIPSAELKKVKGWDWKKKTFGTHKELDDFVNDNMDAFIDFNGDMMFLKAIDRAFWLKARRFPEDETFMDNKCPFKDPTKTLSYIN